MPQRAPLFSWLNKTLLLNIEYKLVESIEDDGVYAEFYSNGQLKHFGFYQNGHCKDSYALHLQENIEEGKAIIENGSGGSADYQIYRNGKAEQFDAWSDNSPAEIIDYQSWIYKWITNIESHAHKYKINRERSQQLREKIEKDGKKSVFKIVKT